LGTGLLLSAGIIGATAGAGGKGWGIVAAVPIFGIFAGIARNWIGNGTAPRGDAEQTTPAPAKEWLKPYPY